MQRKENIVLMEGDEEILREISVVKRKMPLSRKIFIICMIAYQILHFLLFWVYVNADSIVMAFQKINWAYGEDYGKVIFCGFENFQNMFNEMKLAPDLWNCIKNSLILFATNNFIILPISIFCAYIFFKKVPLGKGFRVIFFLPNIISIVVLTMSFAFMFNGEWGPVNQILKAIGLESVIPANGWLGSKETAMGMIVLYCVWAGIGYNVVFLNGAICRIPTEVIESGKLDGIGMWRELFCIVFPLILPTLSTLFINGVTVIFTIFLQPKLLTAGGPYDHITGTIAFYIIECVDGGKLYKAAAVGLFFSAIGIPLVLAVKKLIEKFTPDITW